MCDAVRAGNSIVVLGETGTGTIDFAQDLYEVMLGEFRCGLAIYKGSAKKFFQLLAFQLEIPTENEDGKALNIDDLKEEISVNCGEGTLMILPEAKRLTTSIRYWLQDSIKLGVAVVCFAAVNPAKDVFLEMLEMELALPSNHVIRSEMEKEAKRLGLELSTQELAELQTHAGRNPMIARKVVRAKALGLRQARPEHTQYVVIMPVLIAALFAFAIVRFIGLGTGNQALYVTGGMAFVTATAFRQLGQVRGARRKLGQ